jgi:hypothetical protein
MRLDIAAKFTNLLLPFSFLPFSCRPYEQTLCTIFPIRILYRHELTAANHEHTLCPHAQLQTHATALAFRLLSTKSPSSFPLVDFDACVPVLLDSHSELEVLGVLGCAGMSLSRDRRIAIGLLTV